MGEFWKAVILGLVQGTTEFLPISSSGHLMLFPWLLGWEPHPLSFDVALHIGTLVAVLAYYQRDFRVMAAALLAGIRDRDLRGNPDSRLALLVGVATIPAGVAGFLLESRVERFNDSPGWIGALLIVTGGVLYYAARHQSGTRTTESAGLRDAVTIGFAQALAILPGVSRAGTTIAAGVLRGMAPAHAARFSFYMSVPIIVGAGLASVPDIADGGVGMGYGALAAGVVTAAVSAFVTIHYLLKLLASRHFGVFAYYCVGMGVLVVVLALIR